MQDPRSSIRRLEDSSSSSSDSSSISCTSSCGKSILKSPVSESKDVSLLNLSNKRIMLDTPQSEWPGIKGAKELNNKKLKLITPVSNRSCIKNAKVLNTSQKRSSNRIQLAIENFCEVMRCNSGLKKQDMRKKFKRFNGLNRVKPVDTVMGEAIKKRRRSEDSVYDSDSDLLKKQPSKKPKLQREMDLAELGQRLEVIGSAIKHVALKDRSGPMDGDEKGLFLDVVDSLVEDVMEGGCQSPNHLLSIFNLQSDLSKVKICTDFDAE